MNRWAAHLPVWRDAFPPADRARRAAAEVVIACGPKLAALSDAVAIGLRNAQNAAAVEALEQAALSIGQASLRPLAALTLDTDERVRTRAFHTLSRLVPDHPSPAQTRSDLATLAASQAVTTNAELALAVLELLSTLGDDAAGALPVVLTHLDHFNPVVREAAARFIGRLARSPELSIPPLIQHLEADPDHRTRAASAAALGRFGNQASPAVETLADGVLDESTPVALAAIQSLGRIGPAALGAAATLERSLNDPRPAVRAGSATALGRVQSKSKETVAGLSALVSDDDEYVRLSATKSLAALGPFAEPAIDSLIGALNDSAESVRITAAEALGCVGSAAARARPFLQAARNNNQSVMTRPVLAALEQIESSGAPGVLRTIAQDAKPGR